jgi:hypothetical protein
MKIKITYQSSQYIPGRVTGRYVREVNIPYNPTPELKYRVTEACTPKPKRQSHSA